MRLRPLGLGPLPRLLDGGGDDRGEGPTGEAVRVPYLGQEQLRQPVQVEALRRWLFRRGGGRVRKSEKGVAEVRCLWEPIANGNLPLRQRN